MVAPSGKGSHVIGRRMLTLSGLSAPKVRSIAKTCSVQYSMDFCEDGELCLWRDANFSGCFFDYSIELNHPNLKNAKYDTCPDQKLGDSISSYRNNYKSYTLFLAEHPDFKGYHYCVEGRASGNVIPGFNDKASAAAWNDWLSKEDFKCNHIDQD